MAEVVLQQGDLVDVGLPQDQSATRGRTILTNRPSPWPRASGVGPAAGVVAEEDGLDELSDELLVGIGPVTPSIGQSRSVMQPARGADAARTTHE